MKKIALINNYPIILLPSRSKGFQNAFKSMDSEVSIDIVRYSALKDQKKYRNIFNNDGLILSGSPASLTNPQTVNKWGHILRLIKEYQKPILGICYGHQLIGKAFGFEIGKLPPQHINAEWRKEISLNLLEDYDLFPPNTKKIQVEVVHHEEIKYQPEFESQFKIYASSELCKIMLIKHKTRPLYGTQFHPEALISDAVKHWGSILFEMFIHRL